MDMLSSAAILYAVVCAYLALNGVGVRKILLIVATGLVGGLVLAYTLGLGYYLIVLLRPAETISVFSMIMLVLGASYFAREEILGTITPLGIVLLNIAANFAARAGGPLPLSFAWLAAWIPVQHGPARTALNLLVLYAPSLLALAALRKGPPGAPLVRLLLGLWVCWVGVAALAGPGWSALSQFDVSRPAQWLVWAATAYAGVHLTMLALNFGFAILAKEDDSAISIARSVRIDRMPLRRALLLGAAFWIAIRLLVEVPLPEAEKASLALAAAFGLGALLESLAKAPAPAPEAPPAGDAGAPHRPAMSFATIRLVLPILAVLATLSVFAWKQQSSRQAAWAGGEEFTTGDRVLEIVLLACGSLTLLIVVLLACALYEGVSHGRARRWTAASVVLAAFVGYRMIATPLSPAWMPTAAGEQQSAGIADLPPDRRLPFGDTRALMFSQWLTRKGVKWRIVKKQDDWLVWEDGPRHSLLPTVFDRTRESYWLGIDHYAVEIVAAEASPALDPRRAAAFDTPQQRQRFIAWLEQRGLKPEGASRSGHDFVLWQSAEHDLLSRYVLEMRRRCREEAHARFPAPGLPDRPCN